MTIRLHRRKNYSEITVENGVVNFPREQVELKDVKQFSVDHRAFTCTTAAVLFLLLSLARPRHTTPPPILGARCIFLLL